MALQTTNIQRNRKRSNESENNQPIINSSANALVLQINCNGISNHYAEIQKLIVDTSPKFICLQETRLKEGQTFNLRGYNCIRKDGPSRLRASGGVAIYSRVDIPVKKITINSELQIVTILTWIPEKITIANIYLPNTNWKVADLNKAVDQLPHPYILVGDVKAHNPLWGSESLHTDGSVIEDIIDNNRLVVLNTGEPTHLDANLEVLKWGPNETAPWDARRPMLHLFMKTRLRIGHTNITSSYLLLGRRSPKCEECDEELTVRHILLHCRRYEGTRRVLKIPKTLGECLDLGNAEQILEFLKCIGIYARI